MKLEVVIILMSSFIIYSFLGWIIEVIAIAIKEHRFVNRGITNGPLCPIYGFASIILILASFGIDSIIWIFLGSAIYGTAIELITGKLLEKFNKTKWWDYSNRKYNLDGYICLEYSIIWGLLGTVLIKIVHPLFLFLLNGINMYILVPIIISLMIIVVIDLITSFITLKHVNTKRINDVSDKIGTYILNKVLERIENAYPTFKRKKIKKEKSNIFAKGTSFYKLFLIFYIGGFLGDIVEVFFCRYSMGRWMNRSSLVFETVSLVWGLGLALATILLHKYQNSSNTFIFIFGSVIGGAFEYLCSIFTEFFFGTIFWDYSKIPFNLNGRINLLFCFFWGFAAIVYIKLLYPKLTLIIEKIPKKIGTIVTNLLIIIFMIDLLITGSVMLRYNSRKQGIEATNIVEKLCDKYADDEFMTRHWSNMKSVNDLKN